MVILQLLLKKLDSIIKSREAWLNYQSVFDVLLFVFWGTLNFQLEQSLQKLSFPNHNISVYTFIYLKITERKNKNVYTIDNMSVLPSMGFRHNKTRVFDLNFITSTI